MKAIKIGNNKFINESHIVSFTYTPSGTKQRHEVDGYGVTEDDETIESELVLTLSTGTTNSLHGAPADALYASLTARLV